MKNLYRLIILLFILGAGAVSGISAQSSNPFAGQSYRGRVTNGRFDFHFYMGGGITNFDRQPVPLVVYYPHHREYGLSSSLDTYLGFGYYVFDIMAVGIETGLSVNWNSNRYKIQDISAVGEFWSYATPAWIANNRYRVGDEAEISLTNIEIPIRFYAKLAPFGEGMKWVALQGFVGFDLAVAEASARFFKQRAYGYYQDGTVDQSFFAPSFTAGARLTLAFVGVEYSYHLGLDRIYSNWDYYKNRIHRISIGFSLNTAL